MDLQSTLQTLGYAVTVDGDYGQATTEAVRALQHVLALPEDGIVGMQTRQSIGRDTQGVELLDWWRGGNVSFARFSMALVTDVETGRSFRVWRYGGDAHADVEPLTVQDTDCLRDIYGGEWSWDRRAIWLNVNGRVIAASMNGMPHDGYHLMTNGFDGHIC
ncbi:MAG: peptidoglycan-binding domain-containing protein, partial [Clostridia bacterium]